MATANNETAGPAAPQAAGVLGDEVFRLSERVVKRANEAGLTLASAESCTGGLITAVLTDVSGSSAVVRGGVCSYAVPVKRSVLGVDAAILDDPNRGVVSGACAEAMARGVRDLLASGIAVSTTGIAGPSGAEPGKPVGTVWFGVSSRRGERSAHEVFAGDRQEVRRQACKRALELLIEELDALA